MKKNFAFTLAEVLITLTIIGVIAALTIPNLMKKNFEPEAVAKAKQTYSQISNAWGKYQTEKGCSGEDCFSNLSSNLCSEEDEKIILDNLRVKEHYIYVNNNKTNIDNYFPAETKSFDGKKINSGFYMKKDWGACHFVLENGVIVKMRRVGDWTAQKGTFFASLNITYDINGKKKPNRIGADTFVMGIPYTTGYTVPGIVNTSALGGDYSTNGECYYMINHMVDRQNPLACPKTYIPERVPLRYVIQTGKLPDLSKIET